MSDNTFNQILIVDSIPSGEQNTARSLFEDLRNFAKAHSPSPEVSYVRVENRDEFFLCLGECRWRALDENIYPTLHIECHGNEDGFMFADGSLADWPEIKQPIIDLNVATKLNLMITVAACEGACLAKVVQMSDRAPFWGLIGPKENLYPDDLERAYCALFSTLIVTKAPDKAVEAFEIAAGPNSYWRTTSQGLFEQVWSIYKQQYWAEDVLGARLLRMKEAARIKYPERSYSLSQLKDLLITHEPASFERFCTNFFMYDLYPENTERFRLQYT